MRRVVSFFAAAAVMLHQGGGFVLQRDKGRVHIEQLGLEAHEIGLQLFGGNPDGKHFQRMQTRLGELARSRLHHRRLGILQQQLVQREPLAQLDGLQPFFIA